ncbi:MAG: hypothetical protein ACFFE2_10030 [Candidatus Thorarchaeota archaeon]
MRGIPHNIAITGIPDSPKKPTRKREANVMIMAIGSTTLSWVVHSTGGPSIMATAMYSNNVKNNTVSITMIKRN